MAKTILRVLVLVIILVAVVAVLEPQRAGDVTHAPLDFIRELFKPTPPALYPYIEVTEGCDQDHVGDCINLRTAATTSAPVALQLRTGIVLPIATTTIADELGNEWYRVSWNEWVRYPSRLPNDLYVSADVVARFEDSGAQDLSGAIASTTKHILIDRSEQMLYAYEDEELYMETKISTGRDLTPTPRGLFTVYRKTPSRYMQGPLPGISDQYYDLPGVPWNLYFTEQGGAIHGAYWHNSFGTQWSHGCVNLPLEAAKQLYDWTPLGTPVTVQD